MGKIKVRKKLRKNKNKNKNYLVYLFIFLLFIFIIFVFSALINGNSSKFKVESRSKMVEKNKKTDLKEYKTIGWVRVQGTNIDYPIINVLDKQYGHPVNDVSYAWSMSDGNELTNKIDVAGHNIMNLSVNPLRKDEYFKYFEELMNFVYYDFVKENQFIQLNIDGKDYIYQVFSANFLSLFEIDNLPRGAYTKAQMKDFLEFIDISNIYDFDIDVSQEDSLISLYTCTRFYGNGNVNFVVTGKLLNEKDKLKVVDVKKSERYNEIEKIMKGGKEDE